MSAPRGDVGIADGSDIEALVRGFYARAFVDQLLGPVFTEIAQLDFEAHRPIMCDFWEAVLSGRLVITATLLSHGDVQPLSIETAPPAVPP